MTDVAYKTVTGFVFAGPWDGEAAGKKIRTFMVSVPAPLFKEDGTLNGAPDGQVKVTLWDSHKSEPVNIGDYVAVSGKFEIYEGQNKDGDFVTNYSISANKFSRLGNGKGTFVDRGIENAPAPTKNRRAVSNEIPGL